MGEMALLQSLGVKSALLFYGLGVSLQVCHKTFVSQGQVMSFFVVSQESRMNSELLERRKSGPSAQELKQLKQRRGLEEVFGNAASKCPN